MRNALGIHTCGREGKGSQVVPTEASAHPGGSSEDEAPHFVSSCCQSVVDFVLLRKAACPWKTYPLLPEGEGRESRLWDLGDVSAESPYSYASLYIT